MGNKREERKARRKEKKKQFKRLLEAAKNANITFKPNEDGHDIEFINVFNQIWPILDPALSYVRVLKITKEGVDNTITDILAIGESIAIGGASSEKESEFKDKLDSIWGIFSTGLEIAQTFTPDNVDEVIDDILEVGDWITGNE